MKKQKLWILTAAVFWAANGLWIGTARADDFQVNTYTSGLQIRPSVAVDEKGGSIIVWHSQSSGSPHNGVRGRFFTQEGHPISDEFGLSDDAPGSPFNPDVAMDAVGNFVVVWRNQSIQGQLFSPDGSPASGLIQINTLPDSYQDEPAVAMAPNGDFVVAWEGGSTESTDPRGIQARLFAADGHPKTPQFQVNTYTTDRQQFAKVAMDRSGNFAVVWRGMQGPGDFGNIYAQLYAADGSRVGEESQASTAFPGEQREPDVAMDPDGNFFVVWSGPTLGGLPEQLDIIGQRYASDGSKTGGEFQINALTANSQYDPSIDINAQGDFVVSWVSFTSYGTDDFSTSIQAQRFFADGFPDGDQFQVNTYTTSAQRDVAAAIDDSGSVVMTWMSAGSSGTDTGLSIQRTGPSPPPPPPITEVPTLSEVSLLVLAGLLALLAVFRLRGRLL